MTSFPHHGTWWLAYVAKYCSALFGPLCFQYCSLLKCTLFLMLGDRMKKQDWLIFTGTWLIFSTPAKYFYPFFLLWQDNLRLFFITCKSHQLSGDNSWKAQQHLFCAKPNLFPEGLNIFFGRSTVAIVHFYSLLSCPSSLPFGRLSNIIKLIVVM